MDEIEALRAAHQGARRREHQFPDDRMLRAYANVRFEQLADFLRKCANDASSSEQAKAYDRAAKLAEQMKIPTAW